MDLVTGGAGFIGSHLVQALVARGRAVRVIDDLSTGRLERLANFGDRIGIMQLDLATAALEPALVGIERIFHLAAIGSVPRSVRDPVRTHASVATATLRLLDAARTAQVARFVHSSSSSVYGNSEVSPKHEALPTTPTSPYGVAKLAAEHYVRVFGELHGMQTVSLRYFNVFGPGQDPDGPYAAVIPRFITAALADRPLTIFGDGKQTRDFTYVENVVNANIRAAEADIVPGSIFNVAAGDPHSVLELCSRLEGVLHRPLVIEHQPPRPGDITYSHADIRRAVVQLQWQPKVDFAEGLERTVASFRP